MVTTMQKAIELFSSDEIHAIEAAITEAEKKTTAEIVPVVVNVSGRYDRAEDLFAFLLSLLAMCLLWVLFQGTGAAGDTWGSATQLHYGLPAILATLITTFLGGVVLAARIPCLRRPLISRREMREEVERGARETFQRLNLRRTENATGILIYASLYERMVHVVGDDTITAKLTQTDWNDICQKIVEGFKSGYPEQGLRNGIERSGELLANHFPAGENNPNEVFDTLHLIDR